MEALLLPSGSPSGWENPLLLLLRERLEKLPALVPRLLRRPGSLSLSLLIEAEATADNSVPEVTVSTEELALDTPSIRYSRNLCLCCVASLFLLLFAAKTLCESLCVLTVCCRSASCVCRAAEVGLALLSWYWDWDCFSESSPAVPLAPPRCNVCCENC